MFNVGDKVQYKTHEGFWFTGTVEEYHANTDTVVIDATVYDYRPQYVTRSAGSLRPAE